MNLGSHFGSDEIDHRISELISRLKLYNEEILLLRPQWFLINPETVSRLFWATQRLITDLVALAVDLEYESRIRELPAISEKEKAQIRRESEDIVLDRHKDDLKAMLERVEKVKVFEGLHRVNGLSRQDQVLNTK